MRFSWRDPFFSSGMRCRVFAATFVEFDDRDLVPSPARRKILLAWALARNIAAAAALRILCGQTFVGPISNSPFSVWRTVR